MLKIETGASPQAVLQSAQHVLFVEGGSEGLDVTVLEQLLAPKLRVEPLGPSYSVRSVATALHRHHPKYWFIIDRDEWDDQTVEATWASFPDPGQDNLLMWRRKELESYFLEPGWVCQSTYAKPKASEAVIEGWLQGEARRILWLEAANRVLISKRNHVKRCKGRLLTPGDVEGRGKEEVLALILASDLLFGLRKAVQSGLADSLVREAFAVECGVLTGERPDLAWGHGRWRDLMSAKALFSAMINQWFSVPDLARGGKARLSGHDAERAVAIDLLKNHSDMMPDDFEELRSILERLTR
jgi:hypothetical protein